jgi:DNA-binding transcriptional LysR family regulator
MNQLTLDDFELFVQIASASSLSEVARERGVVVSRVSRSLSRIETECGLRLVRRTTHGLSLTEDGAVFLQHAQRFLTGRHALRDSLGLRRQSVNGTVRISVAQLLAEHVVIPALARLQNEHPELQIDLHIADGVASLAQDGVDIAVRAGIAPADTLVAQALGTHGRALYAAPGYLALRRAPAHPSELTQHRLITNTATPTHNDWPFLVDGQPRVLTLAGALRVNNSAAVASLALAGAGIARINDVLGAEFVRQGRLLPVLADFCIPGEYAICAAVLAERHRAPRIRATMNFLKSCFAAFTR